VLVVFDWDGTLVNSTEKIVSAMQSAAPRCGLAVLADDAVKQIIGLGLPEAIAQLYPDASAKAQEALKLAYSQDFIAADESQKCALYDGVLPCFAALDALGVERAVATGKSRKGLNRMLDNFDWHDNFVATRCADETASKPHPLMLEELLLAQNKSPQQMIMVGDTTFDLEMAKNAGVRSVGVSYGAHRVEQLDAFSPLAVLDCLSDLPAIVEALLE